MTKPGTFVKGHDPRRNMKGRSPRKSLTACLAEALTDDARMKIARRIVEAAKRGDPWAVQFAYQRIDGNVPHSVDITERIQQAARDLGVPEDEALQEAQRLRLVK